MQGQAHHGAVACLQPPAGLEQVVSALKAGVAGIQAQRRAGQPGRCFNHRTADKLHESPAQVTRRGKGQRRVLERCAGLIAQFKDQIDFGLIAVAPFAQGHEVGDQHEPLRRELGFDDFSFNGFDFDHFGFDHFGFDHFGFKRFRFDLCRFGPGRCDLYRRQQEGNFAGLRAQGPKAGYPPAPLIRAPQARRRLKRIGLPHRRTVKASGRLIEVPEQIAGPRLRPVHPPQAKAVAAGHNLRQQKVRLGHFGGKARPNRPAKTLRQRQHRRPGGQIVEAVQRLCQPGPNLSNIGSLGFLGRISGEEFERIGPTCPVEAQAQLSGGIVIGQRAEALALKRLGLEPVLAEQRGGCCRWQALVRLGVKQLQRLIAARFAQGIGVENGQAVAQGVERRRGIDAVARRVFQAATGGLQVEGFDLDPVGVQRMDKAIPRPAKPYGMPGRRLSLRADQPGKGPHEGPPRNDSPPGLYRRIGDADVPGTDPEIARLLRGPGRAAVQSLISGQVNTAGGGQKLNLPQTCLPRLHQHFARRSRANACAFLGQIADPPQRRVTAPGQTLWTPVDNSPLSHALRRRRQVQHLAFAEIGKVQRHRAPAIRCLLAQERVHGQQSRAQPLAALDQVRRAFRTGLRRDTQQPEHPEQQGHQGPRPRRGDGGHLCLKRGRHSLAFRCKVRPRLPETTSADA